MKSLDLFWFVWNTETSYFIQHFINFKLTYPSFQYTILQGPMVTVLVQVQMLSIRCTISFTKFSKYRYDQLIDFLLADTHNYPSH